MNICIVRFMCVLLVGTGAALAQREVYVNGVLIPEADVQVLESSYFVQIPGGHYWYDTVSGLVGLEGNPPSGQIMPGLPLGGALQANASSSGTGVFINGRELHPLEMAYLQQMYGLVYPGRYWMNAQFIGGLEGGPAFFNLAANTSGQPSSAYSKYGTIVSDGSFTGYMPNKSYDFDNSNDIGVSCGPDGGCIYSGGE